MTRCAPEELPVELANPGHLITVTAARCLSCMTIAPAISSSRFRVAGGGSPMRCPRVEGFRAVALFLFSLVLLLMLPGRPAQAQQWIGSIPAASNPYAIAVNSTTNKIY